MSVIDLLSSGGSDATEIYFNYMGFSLDCHEAEAHESDVSVTENPIEGGAVSTDHATIQPKVISVSGFVLDYNPNGGGGDDRMADFYDMLVSLQEAREPATVKTRLKEYNNMILTSVVGGVSPEGKLDLVLRFREIEIVDTQTVSGLVVKPPSNTQKKPEAKDTKPDGTKKAEKPAQQASAPKNKGKTQPQEVPTPKDKTKKSVLAGIFK